MFQDVDIRFNLAQVEARCRQVMGCGFFTFWRPVIFLRISSNKKDGHFKCHFKYVENFGKMMIHQWFFELLVYPLFLTIFRQTHLGWSLSYHFLEFPGISNGVTPGFGHGIPRGYLDSISFCDLRGCPILCWLTWVWLKMASKLYDSMPNTASVIRVWRCTTFELHAAYAHVP